MSILIRNTISAVVSPQKTTVQHLGVEGFLDIFKKKKSAEPKLPPSLGKDLGEVIQLLKNITNGKNTPTLLQEDVDARFFYHAFILHGKIVNDPVRSFSDNAVMLIADTNYLIKNALKTTALLNTVEKKMLQAKSHESAIAILKSYKDELMKNDVVVQQHAKDAIIRYLGDITLIEDHREGLQFNYEYEKISHWNTDKANSGKENLSLPALKENELKLLAKSLLDLDALDNHVLDLENNGKFYSGKVQLKNRGDFDKIFTKWCEENDDGQFELIGYFHEGYSILGYYTSYAQYLFEYGCRYLAASIDKSVKE